MICNQGVGTLCPFIRHAGGVLQRTGTVKPLPAAERTLADPVGGLEIPVPEVPGVGVVPARAAEDLFGIKAAQAKLDTLPKDVMEKVELMPLGEDVIIRGINPAGTFEFRGEKFLARHRRTADEVGERKSGLPERVQLDPDVRRG